MMAKIATKFGRVFGPMGKMPSPQAGIIPQESDEAIKAMLEKMGKAIRVKNKEASIKLGVGKASMSDEVLEENINSVISGLKKLLPRGNDNVRDVLIKFTMTKPVVIVERSK